MVDRGQNYYALLGVPETATGDQIRRAYRSRMKRVHPDRVQPSDRGAAEDQAKMVNLAYRTLSDPQLRRQYDGQLKANEVQDQIMSRYFGGFGAPGSDSEIYDQIRRARMAEDLRQRRRHDRTATVSLLLVFGALLGIAILSVVLWGLFSSIFDWLW
jgi:DnaJ-class molecular chaperone